MKRKNLRNSCKVAGVACAAAGLVSTWDVSPAGAADYSFSGQITPTTDLTSVYFLFAVGICAGGGVFSQRIANFMPANTTTAFNINFSSLPDNLGGLEGFDVFGLYDPVNGGVAMGYDPALASFVLSQDPAPSWSDTAVPVWGSPGPGYQYIGASESDVASALQLGTSIGILPLGDPFPGGISDPSAPSEFTLIDFSGASAGGTGFVVQDVPEPGSLSLLAAGTAVLSFGWLGRRKQH